MLYNSSDDGACEYRLLGIAKACMDCLEGHCGRQSWNMEQIVLANNLYGFFLRIIRHFLYFLAQVLTFKLFPATLCCPTKQFIRCFSVPKWELSN